MTTQSSSAGSEDSVLVRGGGAAGSPRGEMALFHGLAGGRRRLLGLGLPLLFVLVYVYFAVAARDFFSVTNTQDVLRQGSALGIVAFGQTFAIISGGIDLSVGSTIGIASVVDALVTKQYGLWAGMVAAVLVGLLAGLVNGFFVARLRVNPFMVTLGTLSVFEGISLSISGGTYVQGMPKEFSALGFDSLGPIPFAALLAAGAFVAAWVLLTRTRFGREVYAVGGNREAARLSGIHLTRVTWTIYIVTGVLASVAGILVSSRVSSGQPEIGRGLELQSAAAVVLGGVSLMGGEGSIFGVLFGVLLVSFLQNGLNLLNVPSFVQYTVLGGALILAV
ncbi:MAG TPA: ABC transporter permease, partial [Rubrobacteraceae bacterium]|nr:ABC transporter permease [Rubrobacteraceae bacterium]